MPVFLIRKEEIIPERKRYLARAGYKGIDYPISAVERSKINQINRLGVEISSPFLFFDTFRTELLQQSSILPEAFAETVSVTIFVSTLGNAIDERIQRWFVEKKSLEPILLDAWASEALEVYNDRFDDFIRSDQGIRRKATCRFSPGYADVHITKNAVVLEILGIHRQPHDIGQQIRACAETGILTPRKSTVCMIGWVE